MDSGEIIGLYEFAVSPGSGFLCSLLFLFFRSRGQMKPSRLARGAVCL